MNYHTNGVDNSNVEQAGSEDFPNELDSLPTDEFLKILGSRVRQQRSTKSMSRKRLAEVSGVSERYLAQLESGQGNMSIALLRKVTSSIGMSLYTLFSANTAEFNSASSQLSSDPHLSSSIDSNSRSGLSLGSAAVLDDVSVNGMSGPNVAIG